MKGIDHKRGLFTILLACISALAFAQPNASFNIVYFSPDSCAPKVVFFQNTSTGNIVSYSWTGPPPLTPNPFPAATQNVNALIINPGSFCITLTVTDNNGLTDSQVECFTLSTGPTAQFTTNPQLSCIPAYVDFTDVSVPGDAPIVSWLWDFCDGSIDNVQNPTHLFDSLGCYCVTLEVTDAYGCNHFVTRQNEVCIADWPMAGFSATPLYACAIPTTVSFTNLSVGIGVMNCIYEIMQGPILIGTINTCSGTWQFTNPGTYSVSFYMSDSTGCGDTIIRNNYITIDTFTLDFTVDTNIICPGVPITATAISNNPGTAYMSWGDAVGFSLGTTHTYNTSGTYDVCMRMVWGPGCEDTVCKPLLIQVLTGPNADFTWNIPVDTCAPPIVVDFTDNSTGVVRWLWDFDDGTTSSLQNPTHPFYLNGFFDVSLTVWNADSCSDTYIFPGGIPLRATNALWVTSPFNVNECSSATVTFLEASYSMTPIISWFWDVDTGNVMPQPPFIDTFSQQNIPIITYGPGVYYASLIIETIDGCIDTTVQGPMIVTDTLNHADFIGDTIVCYMDTAFFYDMSVIGDTVCPDSITYSWSFGDGGFSSQKDAWHQYIDTGCFNVTLTIEWCGCEDNIVVFDQICVLLPKANFTIDVPDCQDPTCFTITNTSQGGHMFIWDFSGVPPVRDTTWAS
ncbi:MAG TPA: PKD domain-containing protein, partial [Flavobacteriales bacterium]|nr:PKD domain-containing protein [Flavobacteriales bacterium]